MKIKNKVFITTSSSITCSGKDNEELFDNICRGRTGIKKDNNYFSDHEPAIGKIENKKTFYENLIIQCENILNISNIKNFNETLLIVGSSVGGMNTTEDSFFKTNDYKDINHSHHNIQAIVTIVKNKFNFYDDISFSTACTSSANAIGYAYEVLQKGMYKNALVIGVDSICKTTVGGFLSLGVLSSEPCRPFSSDRKGMNVAEGIACLLLETEATENAVEVCGVGYSSDAYHMTQPHPDGSKSAMQNAIESSDLKPEQIDYINAHGTGTKANDESESNSICALFKHKPYVSSTKSITGHTLGAAGALETLISTMVIQNQTIPKSLFSKSLENKELNLTTETLEKKVDYVLSNSFAFGGNNCSLVLGRVK